MQRVLVCEQEELQRLLLFAPTRLHVGDEKRQKTSYICEAMKKSSRHCDWHHCLLALAHNWRTIRKGGPLFISKLKEL